MVTQTFVAVARSRHQEVKMIVTQSLKMTEEEHNLMVYEYGLDFIRTLFNEDSEYFKMIESDRIFWKWYQTEWYFASRKWIELHGRIASNPARIMKLLYQEFMSNKCIESRDITKSFDGWLKAQYNGTIQL